MKITLFRSSQLLARMNWVFAGVRVNAPADGEFLGGFAIEAMQVCLL